MKQTHYFKYCGSILAVIILGLGLIFFLSIDKPRIKPLVISLTKNGFSPDKLNIKKGDTVTFITEENQPFWPASDPHPTHGIYPEFDPQQPIDPGKSWQFTFEREGTFNYHNHLSPDNQGTIVVGKNNNLSSVTDTQTCEQTADSSQKITCWEFLIKNSLDKNGLDASLPLFIKLAQLDPDNCHGYAHEFGEYAYTTYAQGQKIQIGQEASYCGYGFWHGFMTKMAKVSNLEPAKQFCNSLSGSTPALLLEARSNCAHGIGIGLISDPPPVELWGKAQSLIDPALKFCDTLDDQYQMIENCHSGVFHAMITYMYDKQYKFNIDPKNPLELCFLQEEKYRPECYYQIAPKLPLLTNNNLPLVFRLLKQIPDQQVYQSTLDIALINFTNQEMTTKDRIDFFNKCHAQDKTVAAICISSIVKSLFSTGTPEKEYLKVLELCDSKELSDTDRSNCFQSLVSSATSYYPAGKIQEICDTIEKSFRKICTN